MNRLWTQLLQSRSCLAALAAALVIPMGCSSEADEPSTDEDSGTEDDGGKSTSASPDDSTPRSNENADDESTVDVSAEDSIDESGRIVEACQGMKLVGMKYSPGGTTLPNKCAAFHVRDNNPYAVRCIDAMPDFKTPFPGDEYCVLPPPPELGFQLGVHPGGNVGYWEKMWAGDYSFYEDAALTADYEVEAGGERLQNYRVDFEGPTDERYYYRRYFRGRYGSHHGTVNFTGSPETEGWQDNGDIALGGRGGGELITVQNAYTDIPQNSIDVSPEEEGVGIKMTPNSGVNLNLHHFNTTDAPLLRENWINAWYMPKEEVTRPAFGILADTTVNYPIGMEMDNEGVVAATAVTQVLSLWGHRHAWTTRFHAWVVRVDGSEELVYDSNDWFDMPTFSYNSVAKNPEPGDGKDGASSGPLVLQPGDELRFNCHIDTTQERADQLGVKLPDATIEWANEALTGEMCLLMGQSTGGRLFGGFKNAANLNAGR
jgi:hypothetical protein